jgi:hypothetical protein
MVIKWVTAHVRYITDMQQRRRGPDYGLEL